jgi:hypothetical protein
MKTGYVLVLTTVGDKPDLESSGRGWPGRRVESLRFDSLWSLDSQLHHRVAVGYDIR